MAEPINGVGSEQAIQELEDKQTQYIEKQQEISNQIVDKGIEKVEQQVDFEKNQMQKEAEKQATALQGNLQKEINQYGTQNESLAAQGLQNSGYAESSRVQLYNNYQNNVTSIMNTVNDNKAKFDLQTNQAYLDGDIQKAQNALSILQQQIDMSLTSYKLRYDLYQQKVAEEQFRLNYNLQVQQMQQNQANADRDYELNLRKLSAQYAKNANNNTILSKEDNSKKEIKLSGDYANLVLEDIMNSIDNGTYNEQIALSKITTAMNKPYVEGGEKISQDQAYQIIDLVEEYKNAK